MTMKKARLGDGDADAPFIFHKNEKVKWKAEDVEIVAGECEYQDDSSSYTAYYIVKRGDGGCCKVKEIELT